MFDDHKCSRLSTGKKPPGLRRAMGGVYRSRIASRFLMLLALVSALFGGVGLEVCLSEPTWGKHFWVPSILLALAAWLIISALIHAIRMKLFGK